ncbi:hypothetical protein HYC85_009765 [Camellia sinensis]|uniref:Transcription initiation factor TFIID component TAF4 C-terminal domain-containing protein n=1 Tax=Camellia sinensis TaxID=4442 RepID=A0A7J7HHT8_CAMSI|nr:hypothetical protein HYC85_009765 [Camellia sinensis]
MEGIQVILVQKESIDDQQPGQEEQYSVQFFQTKEIQVSQENPANIPDVEKQFLGNQHQHSVEVINRKAMEDWEKQQAEEVEALGANEVKRMVNEILHTSAMNVAAQAAVGEDDLTSKWQLMAKKAPLKHDKRIGAMSNAQLNEQMIYMSSQTLPRKSGDGQESKEKGAKNTFQGHQCLMSQKFVHPISTKDIIAVLERDRQMTNSRFGYCLYERLNAKASAV